MSRITKVSIANFQGILRRLKGDGIIVSVSDPEDRRVRLFDLSRAARQAFDSRLNDDLPDGPPAAAAKSAAAASANGAAHRAAAARG